ncbi:glucosaminidase domain-containing protein [uncultured Ruminococcus sp.]|uniref:glucosaminidase domain-containing protein n=1 Tax=uncultured Ruminococcus sp. TaxID=165186 RepID=UPI00345D5C24
MKPFRMLFFAAAAGAALCLGGMTAAAEETVIETPLIATATKDLEPVETVPDAWVTNSAGALVYYDAAGNLVTGEAVIDGETYLFAPDGTLRTGWQTVGGVRRYYEPETGTARTGWIHYGDGYYYVDADAGKLTGTQRGLVTLQGEETEADTLFLLDDCGALRLGFFTDENGCRYYSDETGAAAVGDVQIDGIWYQFGTDGVQVIGWTEIGCHTYYFDPGTGNSLTGLCWIQGSLYDITPEGGVQTGWKTVSGDTYYFDPDTGTAVSGIQSIDGKSCYFYGDGTMLCNGIILVDGVEYHAAADGTLTIEKTAIMGTAGATVAQMTAYLKSVNPDVPQSVLDMIPYYLSEGEVEGVRGDVAFAQSLLETGNFTFKGSAVTLDQNNFCGMGVTSCGMKGNSFATPQLGIRAQIQHLKAYADTGDLVQACIDTRFRYVQRGCAPYVEWLGIQENPYGKGWAAGADYGAKILRILSAILRMPQ